MNHTDIHSHLLPGIDDGSRNSDMTLEMLRMSSDGGVGRMFFTPHCYPSEPVAEFLQRRKTAEEEVRRVCPRDGTPDGLPAWKLGAEVYYHVGIQHEELLEELCYEGTRYILIEMPWHEWGARAISDVAEIADYRGFVPVIAHLERYGRLTSPPTIRQLRRLPVAVQMNAEYLTDPATRRKALKAVKNGEVDLLGSDAHNISDRKPGLSEAFGILEKAGLLDDASRLAENADRIWEGKRLLRKN